MHFFAYSMIVYAKRSDHLNPISSHIASARLLLRAVTVTLYTTLRNHITSLQGNHFHPRFRPT
jgi:hypothetical protein